MLAITVVWTVSALLITGIILTTLYEKASQRDFRDILLAHTYGVMGAIDVASDGSLTGQPNLGDPRFLTPLSGWHWSVSEAKNPQKLLLFSPSISGEATQIPSTQNVGFDESFRRTFELDGQQYLESQLFLGEKDILYVVSIAASRQGLVRNVSNFRNSLFLFLSVFGFGTIIATYVVIVLGLRPLRQAQEKLSEVREGKADKIEGVYPEEVQPYPMPSLSQVSSPA